MSDTIEVPRSLLRRLVDAGQALDALEDELEDFLLSHDAEFLAELERSREDHLKGNVRPFSAIRRVE